MAAMSTCARWWASLEPTVAVPTSRASVRILRSRPESAGIPIIILTAREESKREETIDRYDLPKSVWEVVLERRPAGDAAARRSRRVIGATSFMCS